jgi:O-methyltransferase
MNEILGIPRDIEGDVVECGCLHGASTANLSLACAITGRKLYVCDSFEGLPEPVDDDDQYTTIGNEKAFYKWKKGKLASIGGIEGVMENVRKFGSIESCVFVKGFFSDTLPTIKTRKIVLIFEDADMYSSVKDVVRYLWKKLQPGCRLYTHEPFSREVVSIFYDREWWKENIGEDYPGLTGSGSDGAMDGIARIWAGYAVRSSKWAVVRDGKSVCF